jgi:hypothetical protein
LFAEIPSELERVQARRQRTTDLEVSDRSNPGVRTNHNRCNSDVILPEMSDRHGMLEGLAEGSHP